VGVALMTGAFSDFSWFLLETVPVLACWADSAPAFPLRFARMAAHCTSMTKVERCIKVVGDTESPGKGRPAGKAQLSPPRLLHPRL
jgi:hypothetical protein